MLTTWQRVLEKFPVGKKFEYLGQPAVVIEARDTIDTFSFWSPGTLTVHTVSAAGVISELEFSSRQGPYLLSL